MKLYSFDVFDTLLTRITASPKGIFALIGEQMDKEAEFHSLPQHIKKNFFILRIQAEEIARKTYCSKETEEITLNQIYKTMVRTAGLNDDWAEKFCSIENKAEIECCIGIENNIKKIKELAGGGKRVILISDMYLEKETIERMLKKIDEFFSSVTLYVSSDSKKTKRNGTLFRHVKEKEKTEYYEWEHWGDNPVSDGSVPNKLGIQTAGYFYPKLFAWENGLIKGMEHSCMLQMLVGTGRNLRLKEEPDIQYVAGASFSAPILLPYVLWIIEHCRNMGYEHLFFIARDGYILKKMADIVIEKQQYPIHTHYIYGSRRAWRLPAMGKGSFNMDELLKWSYPNKIGSLQELADVFGLAKEDLRRFLPCYDRYKDKNISDHVRSELLHILKGWGEEFTSLLYEKNKENRYHAIAYLKQELLNIEGKAAFVDLIGSGYTQKCLAELTKEFREDKVVTYFYSLGSGMKYEQNINYSFFPNRILFGNLIEVFCNAPHGQTYGYERIAGKWRPLLGQDEGELLKEYGFDSYEKGILDYVSLFMKSINLFYYETDNLTVVTRYFESLADERNRDIFSFFMDMPYGITGRENKIESFAPRLSNKMLRWIYLTRTDEPIRNLYKGNSLELSLLRLTENQKRCIDIYKKAFQTGCIQKYLALKNRTRRYANNGYELLEENIIIYGAGERGQLLYRQLNDKKHSKCKVVMWVDKNAEEYRKQGLHVELPNKINEVSYHQIVIAMLRWKDVNEIRQALVKAGVKEHKIIWVLPTV